jgi:hypothetical protein
VERENESSFSTKIRLNSEDLFERGSVRPVRVIECGTYAVWCFMLRNDVPTPRSFVKDNNRVEVPRRSIVIRLWTKISSSD